MIKMLRNAFSLKSPGQQRNLHPRNDDVTDAFIFFNKDYNFFPEDYFRGMLIMERKRTERSQKPFMLMLLDIRGLQGNSKKTASIRKIIKSLNTSTREIDVKGWYKMDKVIGILYTEIGENHKDSIKAKIDNNIKANLSPDIVSLISTSCICLPEDEKKIEEIAKNENIDISTRTDLYKQNNTDESVERTALFCKRCFDIIGSLFFITIFSPIFIFLPLIIKFTSKGSVLFKQKRVGRDGKEFGMLKYRSMHVNNDDSKHQEFIKEYIKNSKNHENASGDKVFKMTDDPRITKIGKFIRKSSIDELPQFLNVLKGEMSLVGPRPAIQYEVDEYDIWHTRRVLEIKPGITGLWQVGGRSKTTFDGMCRMDIQYIRDWSITLDLLILLRTPLAILKGAH